MICTQRSLAVSQQGSLEASTTAGTQEFQQSYSPFANRSGCRWEKSNSCGRLQYPDPLLAGLPRGPALPATPARPAGAQLDVDTRGATHATAAEDCRG